MDASPHFWLNMTNIALGAAVLILLLGTMSAMAWEIAARIKRRLTFSAEIDRDMQRLFRDAGHGGESFEDQSSGNPAPLRHSAGSRGVSR